jgi:hypothetical protein
MNSSENDKLRPYKIRYVADDGELRWLTVEARDEVDATIRASNNDMGNIGGDAIHEIIDVQEA